MKKLFLVAATLMSANVFAMSSDYKFIAANESQATSLCVVAAQEGIASAKRAARKIGISTDIAFNTTKCNGQHIRQFAAQYKQSQVVETELEQPVNVKYVFKTKDQATPSLVCKVAAEQGLRKALKFGGPQSYSYVCNGQNIERFARRYNKA